MAARIRVAVRDQVIFRCEALDDLLTPDHPARAVWDFVDRLDLDAWTSRIKARAGGPGAPALDPRVLMALRLLALLGGIRSAREVSRLTEAHMAYRWICGDEPVNHHSLADFRNADPEALEALMARSAAALIHAGAASLKRVAQDGMRVRADAGAGSFRREPSLRERLAEVEARIERLNAEADDDDRDDDDPARSPRRLAARERAACEQKRRIDAALAAMDELRRANERRSPSKRRPPSELRASMTDPEATEMKMADGGYRPAYDVQFATTVEGNVVVGVAVTAEGVDSAQMEPMLARVEARYGTRPEAWLADGGFVERGAIARVESGSTRVLAPVPRVEQWRSKGKDPYARRAEDTDAVAAWRARMATVEARVEYRQRAATAELVNARARNHGLARFMVRGLRKALSTALWHALAHNFRRGLAWHRTRRV